MHIFILKMLEKEEYLNIKETSIQGRYVIANDIELYIKNGIKTGKVETIGKSVLKVPIKMFVFGTGKKKVLMWSQMHGNEATTTKAVFDLMNFLEGKSTVAQKFLTECSLFIIPMLNPDGAKAYTRVNANKVDLNRDAQDRSEPESRVLRNIYDKIQPDYCFNLHDQRTIYNVGNTEVPASVSFLAPAHDEARTISKTRAISMQLIVAMNKMLQMSIPGRVALYDDAFNANCVGDTFQMLRTPTILFEAGHSPNDYQREETRMHVCKALLEAIRVISYDLINERDKDEYFTIPRNAKQFVDILVRNIQLINKAHEEGTSIGILYEEVLKERTIQFVPRKDQIGELPNCFGHLTYNCLNNKELALIKENKALMKLIL